MLLQSRLHKLNLSASEQQHSTYFKSHLNKLKLQHFLRARLAPHRQVRLGKEERHFLGAVKSSLLV